jgi:hypothetical protein
MEEEVVQQEAYLVKKIAHEGEIPQINVHEVE